jgi:hypothetical protein
MFCLIHTHTGLTYSEFVPVFLPYLSGMQSACAVLLSGARLALLYFSILSPKRYDFREKVIGHKMRVLIFSATFV